MLARCQFFSYVLCVYSKRIKHSLLPRESQPSRGGKYEKKQMAAMWEEQQGRSTPEHRPGMEGESKKVIWRQ